MTYFGRSMTTGSKTSPVEMRAHIYPPPIVVAMGDHMNTAGKKEVK